MAHDHHEHHHHHDHEAEGVRGDILRIVLSAALLAAAVLVERNTDWKTWQYLLLYLIPYLVAGWETLREAAEAVAHGEALDENFLMAVATLGALGIGFLPGAEAQFPEAVFVMLFFRIGFLPGAEAQFPEAVFVMLFFRIGELFEGIAEGRSRRSVAHLMDIRPDSARVERDGRLQTVAPETVAVGEGILVRPGERIPMDGIVLEGSSSLDTVALTGESVPRSIAAGGEAISGCVNLSGVLRIRTTRPFGESTASRILELVEHAAENKSHSERFITRFARIYTPVVVGLAVLLALVPPLLGGSWADWIYRALMFLVVSCPCALVISIPLTFFGGIGGASRRGILVKGAAFLDTLARVRTVVFDKTGTLTEGVFAVTAVHPETLDEQELLHLAAHVERHSTHPIAAALLQAYPDEQDGCRVEDIREFAGLGLTARVEGKTVAVGNGGLMDQVGAAWHPCHQAGTIVHVAVDGVYAGHVVISDRIKEDAAEAVSRLHAAGIRKTVMLTGDLPEVAAAVAERTGVDEFHAGLLPADKVTRVEALLPEGTLAFVGDGINDAPVLARADLGVAMGALGSEAAIEAADVVLMDDRPAKVADAVLGARRTLRIARENIVFAIGVKLAVLALAACGLATMGMAVFADVGVTLLAVLNAMRALR